MRNIDDYRYAYSGLCWKVLVGAVHTPMTYLRPYVINMLKNHPNGEKLKEIRDLARHVDAYLPPTPDPDEEEETRAQKIIYSILESLIIAVFTTGLGEGGVGAKSRSDIRWENLPGYYEQLKQNLPELMDVLDCSKDSIWLATYMVEEGAPGCPLAVSAFEKHLKQCT